MSRYKVTIESHQEDFDSFEEAKRFVHSLPKGTAAQIQDLDARLGETAIYTFTAGVNGYVESRNLPTEPLN